MNSTEILMAMGESVSRKVKKLSDAIRMRMNAALSAKGLDLTAEMYSVLRCLWLEDGLNQQSIAEKSFKEKANLAKILDNLEKRDLVKRHPDITDRRNKLIYLTKKGKQLEPKVMAIAKSIILDTETNIAEKKLSVTKSVLDELLELY